MRLRPACCQLQSPHPAARHSPPPSIMPIPARPWPAAATPAAGHAASACTHRGGSHPVRQGRRRYDARGGALPALLVVALRAEDGADLARGGARRRRLLLRQPPAEPALAALAAVDAQIEPVELARAQHARRRARQRAVLLVPPHRDVGAHLAPHPRHHLVVPQPALAGLMYPGGQQAALGTTSVRGDNGLRKPFTVSLRQARHWLQIHLLLVQVLVLLLLLLLGSGVQNTRCFAQPSRRSRPGPNDQESRRRSG
mmetsp:Transcript_2844/g.7073  ORF Transcript_2844/g.7073 Transcript_2844/m.7073 type:complete len:255 (+) Transcript_2844:493-1257(+)